MNFFISFNKKNLKDFKIILVFYIIINNIIFSLFDKYIIISFLYKEDKYKGESLNYFLF